MMLETNESEYDGKRGDTEKEQIKKLALSFILSPKTYERIVANGRFTKG